MDRLIGTPDEAIEEFCQKHHIRKFSLFGSILRSDFRPESDIDILVEFEEGHVPGFITLGAMHVELAGILGRSVDIRTPASLSEYFRQTVLNNAQVQYEHP